MSLTLLALFQAIETSMSEILQNTKGSNYCFDAEKLVIQGRQKCWDESTSEVHTRFWWDSEYQLYKNDIKTK